MTDPPGPTDGSGDRTAAESNDRHSRAPELELLRDAVTEYATYRLDAEGRIADWSELARNLTGYREESVLGEYHALVFDEGRHADARWVLEEARDAGRASVDGWCVRADGDRFWGRLVVEPWYDGEDALGGYAVVLRDASEHRASERALRAERAFSESILEAQPDLVYAFDADRRFIEWNDRVPEVTGYTDDQLAEMGALELLPERDRDAADAGIERILAEGTVESIETAIVTAAGEEIPYELTGAPIRDEAGEPIGVTGVGRDVSEPRARERELREEKAFTESIFRAVPDVVYAFDTDGTYLKWNDRVPAVTGYDESELAVMGPLEFVAPEDRDGIAEAIGRILEEDETVAAEARLLTKDGTRIPYEFNSARITADDGTVRGFAGVGRDVSDRKARERELERLERLNGVVRRIDDELVTADTREAVESTVVDAFASAEAVQFAVVGSVENGSFDPRAWAGADGGGDAAALAGGHPDIGGHPDVPEDRSAELAHRAVEDDAVAVRRAVDDDGSDGWASPVDERRNGAVAAVPIVAEGRTYGVLLLYSDRAEAFAEREREVLQEFGATVGHAINAMEVRRLVYADTVVELEFESTATGDACIDLSRRAGCRLDVDHVLPVTDSVFLYYVTVTGAPAHRLGELASSHEAIDEARVLARPEEADGGGSVWELIVRGATIAELLVDYGAKIRSKTAEDGRCHLVVEASPDTDVRELVEAIQTAFPGTELVGKREVERPIETRGDFRRDVDAALTEKQRTALEAAYYAGYFEWPTRERQAAEVADTLGIARQTFHQHLRVAMGKLLAAYFERTTG